MHPVCKLFIPCRCPQILCARRAEFLCWPMYESFLVPDLVFRWGIMENEWGFFGDAIAALEENSARLQMQCRMALNAWYLFAIIWWPSFVYMAVVPRTPRADKVCITAGSVRRCACILPFSLMLHMVLGLTYIHSEFNWWRPDCCSHWLGHKVTQEFPVPSASPEETSLPRQWGSGGFWMLLTQEHGRGVEGTLSWFCPDSAASSLVTKEPDRTQGSQMNKYLQD